MTAVCLPRPSSPSRRRLPRLAVATAVLTLGGLGVVSAQTVFRSAVDLVAVDVQVVDRDGIPVGQIGPESFTVSINGRPRRVVSAQFVRHSSTSTIGLNRAPVMTPIAAVDQDETADGRTFILAIDNGSFEPGTMHAVIEAAQHFIDSLAPNDRIGLYVYPSGPRAAPTTERAPIRASLIKVVGEKFSVKSRYNLRPSEIVDMTAALGMGIQTRQNVLTALATAPLTGSSTAELPVDWDPVLTVVRRECPNEADCASNILNDVAAIAPHLENQAASSLGGLDTLLRSLAGVPGRKAVVLISAGVLVSDRKDGRPDVGEMSKTMGQTAARANATVYTVQIDNSSDVTASSRLASYQKPRDRSLVGNWLDEFSAAAGGMRIYVPVGGGEFAFNRVLRETSAHYLLGVEPNDADRDGLPRQLRVKVARPGVTIQSRQWVVIPARSGAD